MAILAVPGAIFRSAIAYAPHGQDGRGTTVHEKAVQNQTFETMPPLLGSSGSHQGTSVAPSYLVFGLG